MAGVRGKVVENLSHLSHLVPTTGDKDVIATWKPELDRVLQVLTVRSVVLTWLSLRPFLEHLVLNNLFFVSGATEESSVEIVRNLCLPRFPSDLSYLWGVHVGMRPLRVFLCVVSGRGCLGENFAFRAASPPIGSISRDQQGSQEPQVPDGIPKSLGTSITRHLPPFLTTRPTRLSTFHGCSNPAIHELDACGVVDKRVPVPFALVYKYSCGSLLLWGNPAPSFLQTPTHSFSPLVFRPPLTRVRPQPVLATYWQEKIQQFSSL